MQTLLKRTGAYQLLKNEGEKEGFSHAYLLSFEDTRHLRMGLKTFAKLFFGCDEPSSPAKKRKAELIDEENFADCLIFPAEGKKLAVDDAEKILEESTLSPVEGDKKLFLIGDFAEANQQTQNKLLKLLEEPPKGVYFLLGTTSVFPVLQTVLSRTKSLQILPFTENEVAGVLQRRYPEADRQTLLLVAATAGGNVGDAMAIYEGGYYASLIKEAFTLLTCTAFQLPATIKSAGETPHKKELLSLLRLVCRDALLIKTGQTSLLLRAEREKTEEVASLYSTRALLFAQEAISAAEKQVKFNAIFSQCLEICIASIKEKI